MNILRNNFVVGFTAALAATIVAPVLVPAIKRSGRPIAKSLVKGGLVLYEKGREAVANAGEVMEDVIAEVRAEQVLRQAAVPGDGAFDAEEERAQAGQTGRPPAAGGGDGVSVRQAMEGDSV